MREGWAIYTFVVSIAVSDSAQTTVKQCTRDASRCGLYAIVENIYFKKKVPRLNEKTEQNRKRVFIVIAIILNNNNNNHHFMYIP